jgi:hypothetical protein
MRRNSLIFLRLFLSSQAEGRAFEPRLALQIFRAPSRIYVEGLCHFGIRGKASAAASRGVFFVELFSPE